MRHFTTRQCRVCLPAYATAAKPLSNSGTSGLGSEIRLRGQDSAIDSVLARTGICHQTHGLANLWFTISLEKSRRGGLAYQRFSSHKHKYYRSAPYSPSPLVRRCIAVLDARLHRPTNEIPSSASSHSVPEVGGGKRGEGGRGLGSWATYDNCSEHLPLCSRSRPYRSCISAPTASRKSRLPAKRRRKRRRSGHSRSRGWSF